MQLYIDTFGTSLHRKANAFEVFKKGEKTKLAPTKIKSIVLSKGAKISSDAVLLAIENEIDIVFVNGAGQPKGRIWSHKFGSISSIRKNQVLFGKSDAAGEWIRAIVLQKIEGQKQLIQSLHRDRPAKQEIIEEAVEQLTKFANKVETMPLTPLTANSDTLRAYEGNASKNYFYVLAKVVPPRYRFAKRSRRPAMDMFNCTLNFLYGCLYQRVEAALIIAGIDPYLGIFHRDEYNRPVLVYDLIEQYRIWADAVALQLCFRRLLEEDFFNKNDKGAYWLEHSGKKVVVQAFNDYLEEVVQMNGKRRSRLTHIQDDAHRLAQLFLKFKEEA